MAIRNLNDTAKLTANQAAKEWIMDCIDARMMERTTETDKEWDAVQDAISKQTMRVFNFLGIEKIYNK